jgi:uncharacterized protein YceK
MRKLIILASISVLLTACGTVSRPYEGATRGQYDRNYSYAKQQPTRQVERRWESDKRDRPANPPEYP